MLAEVHYSSLRPKEVCPNCWGEQYYEDRFYEAIKDLQIDVNNHQVMKSFIQKFVEEHLSGSYLQQEEHNTELYCPICHQRFPHHHSENQSR